MLARYGVRPGDGGGEVPTAEPHPVPPLTERDYQRLVRSFLGVRLTQQEWDALLFNFQMGFGGGGGYSGSFRLLGNLLRDGRLITRAGRLLLVNRKTGEVLDLGQIPNSVRFLIRDYYRDARNITDRAITTLVLTLMVSVPAFLLALIGFGQDPFSGFDFNRRVRGIIRRRGSPIVPAPGLGGVQLPENMWRWGSFFNGGEFTVNVRGTQIISAGDRSRLQELLLRQAGIGTTQFTTRFIWLGDNRYEIHWVDRRRGVVLTFDRRRGS